MSHKGNTGPTENRGIDRRSLFGAAAGAAAALTIASRAEGAMRGLPKRPHDQTPDGRYSVVPLAKDSWTLGVVQSRVLSVDPKQTGWEKKRRANVEHMCHLIDAGSGFTGPKDLFFFHEFPVTGYNWTLNLAETRRIAIEVPGEETEMLAKKCRQYGCWVVFGSYVRDPDWPDSLLSITTILNDKGEIVDKHWKARNIKGVFRQELFTTTIYDVLDRYVEMYGLDAVVPVTRTPLGNLCTSSIQREPEYFRAMAMKGAEVILRTASGGFTPMDIAATSLYNDVYTAVANNAASPGNGLYFEDAGGGDSAVYGPDGKEIDKAPTAFETLVTARIPIASFRARHRQPNVHTELILPVFEQYRSRYGPNLFAAYQPKDLADSTRYLADKRRWPK
jgi:predicted amidohydrolase